MNEEFLLNAAEVSHVARLTVLWVALTAGLAHANDEPFPPAQREHWAWKVPERSAIPENRGPDWGYNPVDAFILARLRAAGLEPAPAAAPGAWLRRVTFDLTGLPPTPDEVVAFLANPSLEGRRRVVDRLLASPRYGERWGRHWLDVARFAESNGFEFDEVRPDAWRYRDYVIASFNADKPYPRFIQEQLAGDELWPEEPEALVATGFNLLGADMTDASDQRQRRQNTLNDMTDVAGLAFLGLTLGCARCHDHKFEPIAQRDYYRMQAFFTPTVFRRDLPVVRSPERQAYEKALRAYEDLVRPSLEAQRGLEEPYRQRLVEIALTRLSDEAREAHRTAPEKRNAVQKELVEKTTRFLTFATPAVLKAMTPADRARHEALQNEVKRHESRRPTPLPVALGLSRPLGTAPPTFLLERGELGQPGEKVEPGIPSVLPPFPDKLPLASGQRSALAHWIVSPNNPLTARVLVNRLWHHHFGRGLVATPSDFGLRGERPSHPELLDWLAVEFQTSGGSLKHLHRLLVLSATYGQATEADSKARELDPDNRLLSRSLRIRLEGEAVRDALLSSSGRLSGVMGGRGDAEPSQRRSVYLFARRNLRPPFLETFDLPDSNLSCSRRERSTTALQALSMLNSPEAQSAAQSLAQRVAQEAQGVPERIRRVFLLTLCREPTAREQTLAEAFLNKASLEDLCRALGNVNEFVYLD